MLRDERSGFVNALIESSQVGNLGSRAGCEAQRWRRMTTHWPCEILSSRLRTLNKLH